MYMKRNKSYLATVVALLVIFMVTGSLYAGDTDRIGTAAASELKIPVGGKNFAMGGADLATTAGLDAIYWNPAGLVYQRGGSALFTTMSYFGDADIRVNYLALAYSMGSAGTVGLFWKSIGAGDIPLTTNSDPLNSSGATFNPDFNILGLTWSNKFSDAISFGISAKVITEGVPQASATTWAVDLGLQYRNLAGIEGLSFGVAAMNVGGDMVYEGSAFLHGGTIDGTLIPDYLYSIPTETFELPTNYQIGLSYKMRFSGDMGMKFAGTFVSENLGADRALFGGEFVYNEMLFLRAGYQYDFDVTDAQRIFGFHGGVGVKWALNNTVAIHFDYVYRAQENFDGNHLFGIQLDF
jgi:hypothetical protein